MPAGNACGTLVRFRRPGWRRSPLLSLLIAHIATATLPDAVLHYLRAGQVTPLAKPTGGHRPLLMMSFLRRLALKAVVAAKKPSVLAAAGTLQRGVGWQDGANKMIKSIQYFAEVDPTRVLVALVSPGAPYCSASDTTILIWPRSSPDGTRAPPRTYVSRRLVRAHPRQQRN